MMLMRVIADETAAAAFRVGPPSAVASVALFNVSLQDWVYVFTLILIAAQLAYLLWKWRKERRKA